MRSASRVLRNFALGALLSLAAAHGANAQPQFPFGRELLLDAAPMRPGKRMPAITVAANGAALIDLWCRSVRGQVEFADNAIRITAEPLPEALPPVQGAGQCTPARIQADEDLLAALTQAASWRMQGDAVVLDGGAKPMRFRAATN